MWGPCVGTLAMSQANGSNGEPDYSQLYVYAGPDQPDPSNMTVYASDNRDFKAHPLQANIIGSSHYISIPGLRYRELTSCRPIQMARDFDPVVMHYDITAGIHEVLNRQAGPYDVKIQIDTFDFFEPEIVDSWDFSYTFEGEEPAPTAINYRDDGWETIHVYPEFDVDLYTATHFNRRDGA